MGGEEEDERLDSTLLMLENQGIVPSTPGSREVILMSTPKIQGDMERIPPPQSLRKTPTKEHKRMKMKMSFGGTP